MIFLGIAAEKRQFKEQTKEAERFNYLTGKIDKLNIKQNLIQLFNLQKEIAEWEEKKAAKTQKLVDLEKTQISLLEKLDANKRDQAKIHQQSLKQQKKIREGEKALEKKRPSAIEVSISFFNSNDFRIVKLLLFLRGVLKTPRAR